MSTDVNSGTYYITCQVTATVLTFADGSVGSNLTAWEFISAADQRWNVTNLNGQYTIRNIATGNYISFAGLPPPGAPTLGQVLHADTTPYPWIIQAYHGGYLMGSPQVNDYVVNLAGASYSNNTNVILWPLTLLPGSNNAVWYFNKTTPDGSGLGVSTTASGPSATSTAPFPTSHRSNAGAIAGGVIGGLVLLTALLALAFVWGKRHQSSATQNHFWSTPLDTAIHNQAPPTVPPPVVRDSTVIYAPPIYEPPGAIMSVQRPERPLASQLQNPVISSMRGTEDVATSSYAARPSVAADTGSSSSLKKSKSTPDSFIPGLWQPDSLNELTTPTYNPNSGDDRLLKGHH